MSQQEFIVWLFGMAGGVVVLVWLIYWVYRAKLLEREERRAMIERGIVPPAPAPVGWPGVKIREMELKAEEHRLRIEKGLDVPTEYSAPDMFDKLTARLNRKPEAFLRRGLVALFAGLGLGVAYVLIRLNLDLGIAETREWLLALSIVAPLLTLYGLAYVVFYHSARDRLNEQPTAPGQGR
jgi:hypothetical protein